MASQTYNGSTWTYSYNNAGLRTSRSNGSVTYHYIYNGDKLTQMTIADEVNHTQQVMDFTYDANGQLLTMTYGEEVYYYILSLQGDVAGITDSQGNRLIDFHYEGYGAGYYTSYDTEKAALLAQINPFGYRSYVMDLGTGFYYLQSRYYDPTLGRFINADGQIAAPGGELLGTNQFAYCFNNPVRMDDSSGNWPRWATKLVAAVAVVAVVAAVAVVSVATCGAGSAIAVIAVGAAKGAAIGFAVGAATGAASGAINHRVTTGSWEGAGEAALNGMADGAFSGAVSGAITGGFTSGLNYNPGATSTGKGFGTFKQLKKEIGSPGAGNEWHHIVEQCQIAKSGFSPQMIHNTNNIISINKTTHRAISAYYSSKQLFTDGMTVRNWLAGQSFSAQYEFGINIIKIFM